MKHLPAAAFIPSFEEDENEIGAFLADERNEASITVDLPAFPLKTPREPAPDLGEIFERGREAGLAEARGEAERQIVEMRRQAEAALATERQRWADEVAVPLAAQLPEALQALAEPIAETVGRLLRPFMASEMRDAACRALIQQISPLLAGAGGALIRVSGPPVLIATLRFVFPENQAVEFVESEASEVTILTQDTVIETRIGEWVARLEGQGPDRRRRRRAGPAS